jgi:probable HAF family extracellular repeat protein
VTGSSDTTDVPFESRHAFLWDGTTMRDLGTLEGFSSSGGAAINASGQVAGTATTADGGDRAFLWNGTTMLDLGTLGGGFSQGADINDSGRVTGVSLMPGGENVHAFVWDGTTMQDLGPLVGTPLEDFSASERVLHAGLTRSVQR